MKFAVEKNRKDFILGNVIRQIMTTEKIEGVNIAKRYVIISDTHFGEAEAILSNDKEVEIFSEKLKKYGAINEFILLGDIFEFGTATAKEAISDSVTFFNSLGDIKKAQKEDYNIDMKVILMIGNHDHYIISECRKNVSNSNSNDYKSSLVFSSDQFSAVFNNIFGSSPETERLTAVIDEIRYPEYEIQLNKSKKRILLRHGHHADKVQTGLAINAKVKKLITGKYTENDFEAGMTVYYPFTFYPHEEVGKVRGFAWKARNFVNYLLIRKKIKNNRRISSREEVMEGIDLLVRYKKLLDENHNVKFDYFIFGHTHNACFCDYRMTDLDFKKAVDSKDKIQEYYEFDIGIINSGGWLNYERDVETTRNYIVIDENQIMLCSADMDEPIKREILNKE